MIFGIKFLILKKSSSFSATALLMFYQPYIVDKNNMPMRHLKDILSKEKGNRTYHCEMVRFSFQVVKRIIANKNITIFKVNNTELFCQVELPLSDYPLYGKQIAAS